MTVGLSNVNLATRWLNVLRNTAATAVTTCYVELHTADPGASGTTGVSVGSTTRVAATFAIPSGGAIALSNAPQWTNGGTSETISHIAVFDAASAGNFLFSAQLTTAKAWANGDTLTLNTLGVSLTPLAA
jgi:hypothetical protein